MENINGLFVREHIPLEQGLRLPCERLVAKALYMVREHIPLEQGLRRLFCLRRRFNFAQSESIFH